MLVADFVQEGSQNHTADHANNAGITGFEGDPIAHDPEHANLEGWRAVAIERLNQHPEPEAGYMLVRQTALPAYNVRTAVDTEHALIVAHAVWYSMLPIDADVAFRDVLVYTSR